MVKAVVVGLMMVGGAGAQVVAPAGGGVCKVIAADATDGVVASPEHHRVLYETEDVRVIEVHSAPHTSEPMHSHARPAVMYVDSQGAGRLFTPEDMVGKSHPTDPNFKPRIFATAPEGLHATENTGEVPFHAIRVEFKHPGCSLTGAPVAKLGPEDALIAAPGGHTLLFENDDVRVVDVHMAPHSKEPMHTHPWEGFFYIVTASPLRYSTPENPNPPISKSYRISRVGAEGLHSVENVGDAPVEFVRFELKYAGKGKE
jgi:quercetin dioxygenase-like cupin family protein